MLDIKEIKMLPGSNFIQLLKHKQLLSTTNVSVPGQNTMSRLQFVTGVLFISAKQNIVRQYYLLKQLYEIGPRCETLCPEACCQTSKLDLLSNNISEQNNIQRKGRLPLKGQIAQSLSPSTLIRRSLVFLKRFTHSATAHT